MLSAYFFLSNKQNRNKIKNIINKHKFFTIRYNIIKDYHSKNDVPDSIDPQHKSLLPKLRPYQKNAVKWMVHREKSLQQFQDDEKSTKFQNNELHTLYTQVITKDGTKMYYNRKGGFLVKEFPHARPMPTGGILADEMVRTRTTSVKSFSRKFSWN